MNKVISFLLFIITLTIGSYYFSNVENQRYIEKTNLAETTHAQKMGNIIHQKRLHEIERLALLEIERLEKEALHITPPDRVRAIYMSSWVGGTKSFRSGLIEFIKESDINAVVLDIKDSTGFVSFPITDPVVNRYDTDSSRISDIHALVQDFHDNDIYIIGRLTLFQDPLLAERAPELAFTRKDNGETWKDRKGLAFINPKKQEALTYFGDLSEYAYNIGFDEINFDYIRYPSDGVMANLDYDLEPGEKRTDIMKSVYKYLDERLRSQDIPISADLFGMTTVNTDDLSIGQYLEDALVHFDYVAPMVYPSHYPNGFKGYTNPAEHPYEIVYDAMDHAVKRAKVIGLSGDNLRTWIQDFDMGATYGSAKIHEQIQASYDTGVDSYMVWDPRNRYTKEAYIKDLIYNETIYEE